MRTFDAAVLGLGTMGSFVAWELARRGLKVAGFDRFGPPHNRGSHSGDTRVFRIAYAEHPDYVPLAQRAGTLWDEHSLAFHKPLLTRTGMLSMGPPEGDLLAGIRASAGLHRIPIEELSCNQIADRFPAFRVPDSWSGIFEPSAGWVDVNAAIEGALEAAERHGATIFRDSPVTRWHEKSGRILIETGAETFEVDRVVITAGAWASSLLRDLNLPLQVQRKVLVWIDPAAPEAYQPDQFPVFAIADRFFYGFPNIGGHGVKLAIHWETGSEMMDLSLPGSEPTNQDIVPVAELALHYLRGFGETVPDALTRVRRAATCLYTMTPDEHFIVDRHPTIDLVWIAAGFSGHGFKFAPAIAEALADLCTQGETRLPIDFLRIQGRFNRSPKSRD